MRTQTLLTGILILFTSTCFASIINVKQDGTGNYETIQEGVDASVNGDTVLVYPGIYSESIYFNNKRITLASLYLITLESQYINQTIIDPGFNGASALGIGYCTGGTPIINGFTLQHGGSAEYEGKGGGIHIEDADCEIRNCIVQNNIAEQGGGICVENCSVVIINCTIQNNLALSGGGVYSRINANVTFHGVTIKFNQAKLAGGGIRCGYNSNTIFDPDNRCNIYLNYSSYGSDYLKWNESPEQVIFVDTFTVLNPDQHFVYSYDDYNFPVNDLTINIQHAKIEPINQDLFVNPVTGDNQNDGLSPDSPLRTISFAYHIIASDSQNPKTIYLSNGIYSLTTNNEIFPLNGRSHVSLIGVHPDSTILDVDFNYFFLKVYGLMENISIKNISFKNGFGNLSLEYYSGLIIEHCNNLSISHVKILNCTSSYNPAVYSSKNDNISFSDILIENCKGGFCFSVGNTFEPPKTFKISNCKIINNGPDSNPEIGVGGGLVIIGSLSTQGLCKGNVKNIQITDNLQEIEPDPNWGPGSALGIIANNHAKVDLINATIGNNIVRYELGSAVNVDEGSEINIYNSILFGDSLLELSLGSYSGVYAPATAKISFSDIEGGEEAILNWYNQNTLNWLDGNMDEDPLWAGTGDTAYYLLPGSPCINAGTPMYEEGMELPYIKIEDDKIVLYKYDGDTIHLPATDLAGKPRISGGRIDMGAYEYQDTTTGIGNPGKISRDDSKVQVYPNPFSAHTFITFRIQNPAQVVVKITDINGRPVKTLMDAKLTKGEFSMTWKGEDDEGDVVKKGIYIVTFYLNGVAAEGVKIVKRNGG